MCAKHWRRPVNIEFKASHGNREGCGAGFSAVWKVKRAHKIHMRYLFAIQGIGVGVDRRAGYTATLHILQPKGGSLFFKLWL